MKHKNTKVVLIVLIIIGQIMFVACGKKEQIILGTFHRDVNLEVMVAQYNETGEKEIIIKNYMDDNMDYDQAVKAFVADILNGEMDIVDLSANIEYFQILKKKDAFEELELGEAPLLENILTLGKYDSKQYGVISSFGIKSLFAKKSKASQIERFDIDYVSDYLLNNPTKYFWNMPQTEIYSFHSLLVYAIDDYINVASGTEVIDKERFLALLDLCKQENIAFRTDREWMEEPIRQDQYLVLDEIVSSLENYCEVERVFGEEMTMIGFPSDDEAVHNVVYPSTLFCLIKNTKYKEEGMDFIKMFLTDEYQQELTMEFPVLETVLDSTMQEQKTLLNNNYEASGITYRVTDERISELKDAILNTEKMFYYDSDLLDIIESEAQLYFENKKSRDEVYDEVENRVRLYFSE